MICGKFREEMWEKKKRNLGEFSSKLCQGLDRTMCVYMYRCTVCVRGGTSMYVCVCMYMYMMKRLRNICRGL